MISSKDGFNPRFAHETEFYPKTIAYVRDNDVVYFAYSRVNRKDAFNKKIGREVSTAYLNEAMKTLPLMSPYFTDEFYLDEENRCGFLTFNGYIRHQSLDRTLSDQLIANMGFFDIKHVSICDTLVYMIECADTNE